MMTKNLKVAVMQIIVRLKEQPMICILRQNPPQTAVIVHMLRHQPLQMYLRLLKWGQEKRRGEVVSPSAKSWKDEEELICILCREGPVQSKATGARSASLALSHRKECLVSLHSHRQIHLLPLMRRVLNAVSRPRYSSSALMVVTKAA